MDWEGTWPDAPTDEERAGSATLYAEIEDITTNNPTDYSTYEWPMFGAQVTTTLRDLLPRPRPSRAPRPSSPTTTNAGTPSSTPAWKRT